MAYQEISPTKRFGYIDPRLAGGTVPFNHLPVVIHKMRHPERRHACPGAVFEWQEMHSPG